jgi:hypothetical protein
MFGRFFKPRCPCDPAAKRWVERRLQWLSEQFPQSAFSGGRVVLPTPEFFPDRFDGSEARAQELVETVCLYMRVNPTSIRVRFWQSDEPRVPLVNGAGQALPTAAGTFEGGDRKHLVTLGREAFARPMELVGTVAHELAHARLLGERRLDPEVFDNELLTDLTTVHLGLGVFLANSPRDWMSGYTTWPGTALKKPEYMNRPMYGWALALLAYFRDERRPAWAAHLSRFARLEVEQGLRYLEATGDTSYRPPRVQALEM